MSDNAFLQPLSFYKREINPLKNYVDQMATGLAMYNNTPFEHARGFIVQALKTKAFPEVQDPMVDFFGRDANGDRTIEQLPLTRYLHDVVSKNEILVPTFTAYCSVDECESPLSVFIAENVKVRSLAKKTGQKAKDEGNMELAFIKNVEQANKKENNNSLSGAFATDSSIFENETGHNTLTSITRSMASIGNALNERMIGGNRHYRTVEVAINNILAIVHTQDMEATREAIERLGIKCPSVKETMEVFKKSLKYYVFDHNAQNELLDVIAHLSPLQRAAVAYNQDFYHLRVLNEGFVRGMIDDFSRINPDANYPDPCKVITSSDGLIRNYAHQVLIDVMKGRGTTYSDEKKMDMASLQLLAGVCENIGKAIEKYRPIIKAFFLTKTVPSSTAYIQDMVRENVVLSDTDSTMFSVDEWVTWYFGKLNFSQHGFGVAGAVMFMSTQCIAHCLAILSANMGVAEDKLFVLAMKPEFAFPVFVQSPVAKHYFTAKLVCEGSVYEDIEMEIKGVHNKNSANPSIITIPAQERMEHVIRTVMAGNDLSEYEEIALVANIERDIINSLKSGQTTFLKGNNIKEASAYRQDIKKSAFAVHTLWECVFAPKYGSVAAPPYGVVKVPTTLTTPTAFKKWLAEMKDQQLAARMAAWAEDHGKKKITTFYLNRDLVDATSIPQEILDVIDYRKIVLDLTNVRRMLLDSLGFPVRENYLLTELGY